MIYKMKDSAEVVNFNETTAETPFISDETFYYRFAFNLDTKKIEVHINYL